MSAGGEWFDWPFGVEYSDGGPLGARVMSNPLLPDSDGVTYPRGWPGLPSRWSKNLSDKLLDSTRDLSDKSRAMIQVISHNASHAVGARLAPSPREFTSIGAIFAAILGATIADTRVIATRDSEEGHWTFKESTGAFSGGLECHCTLPRSNSKRYEWTKAGGMGQQIPLSETPMSLQEFVDWALNNAVDAFGDEITVIAADQITGLVYVETPTDGVDSITSTGQTEIGVFGGSANKWE